MYGPRDPRPPLPTPPLSPLAVKSQSYGPSSSFIRSSPYSPFGEDPASPPDWIPYQPVAKASGFFVKDGGVEYRTRIEEETRRVEEEKHTELDKALNPKIDELISTPPSKKRIQRIPPPPLHPPPSKIPLASTSSILVHSGFWQILSSTGSKFYNTPTNSPPRALGTPEYKDNYDGGYLGLNRTVEGRRAVTNPELGIKKKKVEKDQIGSPHGYVHLIHASDYGQAEEILRRWNLDGVGKLGAPSWAHPIKEASRARSRARSIAQIQDNRQSSPSVGALKVTNGITESIISSTSAQENYHEEEYEIRQENQVRPGLKRMHSSDSIIIHELDDEALIPSMFISDINPESIIPSLVTIEKTVSAKVYFETLYHGILKKESVRNQRLNQLEKELAASNMSSSQKVSIRAAYVEAETEHLRYLRSRVDINSFTKLKTIGHGAFGVVSIVKSLEGGKIYAMKQLKKSSMLLKQQEGHVRAERDLLERAEGQTKWTTRLIYSFQDTDLLYLVMEYCGGGDLLNLLIERDIFEESFAKFYIAEMILAIEETHKTLGAIHRDVKPDNFLISNDGHIRISSSMHLRDLMQAKTDDYDSDFGLATDHEWAHSSAYYEQQRASLFDKHGIDLGDARSPATDPFDADRLSKQEIGSILTIRDRHRRKKAYSMVGTNNYMSVEVLGGQGYTESCDWWSLGCILFECVYGFPPFCSKSRQVTRNKIMNWRTSLKFPSEPRVSRQCQNLIKALICEEADRIGSSTVVNRRVPVDRYRPNSVIIQNRSPVKPVVKQVTTDKNPGLTGADAIKAHPWFKGIDFKTLHLQTPPFVPVLENPWSTTYFEQDIAPETLLSPGQIAGEPEQTRDKILAGKDGEELLRIRKESAFSGWTYKSRLPEKQVYDPRKGLRAFADLMGDSSNGSPASRGRSKLRVDGGSGFIRSLSV